MPFDSEHRLVGKGSHGAAKLLDFLKKNIAVKINPDSQWQVSRLINSRLIQYSGHIMTISLRRESTVGFNTTGWEPVWPQIQVWKHNCAEMLQNLMIILIIQQRASFLWIMQPPVIVKDGESKKSHAGSNRFLHPSLSNPEYTINTSNLTKQIRLVAMPTEKLSSSCSHNPLGCGGSCSSLHNLGLQGVWLLMIFSGVCSSTCYIISAISAFYQQNEDIFGTWRQF